MKVINNILYPYNVYLPYYLLNKIFSTQNSLSITTSSRKIFSTMQAAIKKKKNNTKNYYKNVFIEI